MTELVIGMSKPYFCLCWSDRIGIVVRTVYSCSMKVTTTDVTDSINDACKMSTLFKDQN